MEQSNPRLKTRVTDSGSPYKAVEGARPDQSDKGRWNMQKDQVLLLAVDAALKSIGHTIPYDIVAKFMGEDTSPSAISARISRIRSYRLQEGRFCPPLSRQKLPMNEESETIGERVTPASKKRRISSDDDFAAPNQDSLPMSMSKNLRNRSRIDYSHFDADDEDEGYSAGDDDHDERSSTTNPSAKKGKSFSTARRILKLRYNGPKYKSLYQKAAHTREAKISNSSPQSTNGNLYNQNGQCTPVVFGGCGHSHIPMGFVMSCPHGNSSSPFATAPMSTARESTGQDLFTLGLQGGSGPVMSYNGHLIQSANNNGFTPVQIPETGISMSTSQALDDNLFNTFQDAQFDAINPFDTPVHGESVLAAATAGDCEFSFENTLNGDDRRSFETPTTVNTGFSIGTTVAADNNPFSSRNIVTGNDDYTFENLVAGNDDFSFEITANGNDEVPFETPTTGNNVHNQVTSDIGSSSSGEGLDRTLARQFDMDDLAVECGINKSDDELFNWSEVVNDEWLPDFQERI